MINRNSANNDEIFYVVSGGTRTATEEKIAAMRAARRERERKLKAAQLARAKTHRAADLQAFMLNNVTKY